ncbi:MAG: FliM/FliN family flagellar motor switch protein [Candidatus Eremiobacteraeota bacterium]|nr:FliM/FliN family flagellar motor switch protein [Candidatus Eremiobacteraeota bacterium]MBC5801614.1 FliM/FliN family flagellar motor switch protein [Candidatus Eremiobacteraeota bacterium]MBC5821070.1 FliM/FliN family flagellar motor switch protein [Candidatus Eremiobacteraeota bacterium]
MITSLEFVGPQRLPNGSIMRSRVFRPRSGLPLAAACVVANGVREQLSTLLAAELDVELIEPAIPGADQRRILVAGATILRVRGRVCDGFVIIRPADARRLVALAFGEAERPERDPLSEIERTTLDRIVAALVPLCNSLCGTLGPSMRENNERAACDMETYFEVRTAHPARVAVGFGLACDPCEEIGERLSLEVLRDVELAGVVEFGAGRVGIPAFSRLDVGATLTLESSLGAPGTLRFGDVVFARGACGIADGRSAIVLDGSSAVA